MKVEDVWRVHRQWAAVAARTTAALRRWRTVNLALILSAAVLGALAGQRSWLPDSGPVVLGSAGAAALGLAAIVQARFLTADKVRARIGSRAASEALKGLVYQQLAGVGPLAAAGAGSQLSVKVGEVQSLSADHAALVVHSEADGVPLPKVSGVADYVRERARGQRDWHQDATRRHKKRARRLRGAELIATVVAAVLAAVAGAAATPGLSPWVGVATTAGTAIAAHLASEQHDRIAGAYARTVLALDIALGDFDPDTASEEQATEFVADVETLLAAQNDSWVSLFTSE